MVANPVVDQLISAGLGKHPCLFLYSFIWLSTHSFVRSFFRSPPYSFTNSYNNNNLYYVAFNYIT